MYLDPATRTKVEETGGANFIFITKDGTFVTPKSCLLYTSIGETLIGMKVQEFEESGLSFDEVVKQTEEYICLLYTSRCV